jgi:hypothetical protein
MAQFVDEAGNIWEGAAQDDPNLKFIGKEATPEPAQEEGTFLNNAVHGLTTNEPTKGVGGVLGRGALPAIGSGLGAMGGTVAGMGVGSIPGAGIGSAAGESARQSLVSAFGKGKPRRLAEVVAPVATEGALGMLGQKGGEMVSGGVRRLADAALPQLTSFATKVPTKFTEAAVKGNLKGAPTVKAAGSAYEDLISSGNMRGLDKSLEHVFDGKLNITTGDWIEVAQRAKTMMNDGTLTPQDALWARQAIAKYQTAPRLQKESFAGVAAHLDELQTQLDDYLETAIPGFADVRNNYFRAKGKEAFDSWLPLNKDKSPDTLRFLMTSLAQPAGLPIMSPKIAGGAIAGMNAVGPVLDETVKRAPTGLGQLMERFYPQQSDDEPPIPLRRRLAGR